MAARGECDGRNARNSSADRCDGPKERHASENTRRGSQAARWFGGRHPNDQPGHMAAKKNPPNPIEMHLRALARDYQS
ncbi:MAG: hypothetical protein M0P17_09605 [Methanoculleus sp.]|nr:hypothetical protein [Methanoculleus sp.]